MGSHTHITGNVYVCVCLCDMHPQAISSFLHVILLVEKAKNSLVVSKDKSYPGFRDLCSKTILFLDFYFICGHDLWLVSFYSRNILH